MDIYLLSPPEKPFLSELPDLVEAGFERFQYRRPALGDRERYEELDRVRSILSGTPTELIVNNRPDLARSVSANGVHLGQDDLPVKPVKNQWPDLTVGRTHRAGEGLNEFADYYGIGPVFSSFSKSVDAKTCGWDGIREVLDRTEKDVYAIGGIDRSRLEDAPSGLAGICVIGAVWEQGSPGEALRRLKEEL